MFEIDNFTGEAQEVYQRCILLSGKCNTTDCDDDNGYVLVETKDEADQPLFPEQRWPMCRSYFKALVLLSPGLNKVVLTSEKDTCRTEITIRYTPLLQTPPLHLAIMVAKDSPLLIDCPPTKFGQVSSTHSSLDAAIAKFRITAYMWQALTAEDLRAKGLGRRSFRIEEEWAVDTLSRRSLHSPTMGLVPKVHLIRTDKTVAELRDAQLAQQNPRAYRKDELHAIFTRALQAHGGPFVSHANPIVAGLILDSHYDLNSKLILAHAALGSHDPKGLSLGMFGSHLTYAWPRFLEEVPDSLLDPTPPGDTVGNDNNECTSMWAACAVGQGAFLHEVGHALSAPHTSGIMQRGYSPDWPKVFLTRTASSGQTTEKDTNPITPDTKHDCTWDVRDALRFRNLPHFKHPGDKPIPRDTPTVTAEEGDDGNPESAYFELRCAAGIALVTFTPDAKPPQTDDTTCSITNPTKLIRYLRSDLTAKFPATKPLKLEVTALNGTHKTIPNLWTLFKQRTHLRIPGTDIYLTKQSVGSQESDGDSDDDSNWTWAVMLKKRDSSGSLVDATKIDIRVGALLDGAVVYYADGEKVPCGPRKSAEDGGDPHMGGHQARKLVLAPGEEVVKVAVTRMENSCSLEGLRMWLGSGKGRGALNLRSGGEVEVLVPPAGHKIIGFYGTSGRCGWGLCTRFGIVTAPRDVVLPDSVYDMEELQNNPDRDGHRNKRRRIGATQDEDGEKDDNDDEDMECDGDESDDDESTASSDRDCGYDDGSDDEMKKIYER